MVDIIVLGATGYTGSLITRYLHAHRERKAGKFTYAIAGRNKTKLAELARAIRSDDDDSLGIYEVDVTNFDDVEKIVQQAKVIVNAVGPYWRWGKPVVKACARHGVDYVDITGETAFVQDIIADYDYLACKNHAVIIPSCGFDSLPSDILVYLSARLLKEKNGSSASIADSYTAYSLKGGTSGGTMATVIASLEEIPKRRLIESARAYALSPITGPRVGRRKLVNVLPYFSPKRYGIDFPLAPHNRAIVQRTWGLLQLRASSPDSENESVKVAQTAAYGMDFKYREYLQLSSPITAFFLSLGFAFGQILLFAFPPARWLFKKFATPSGQGPSDEVLENGFLRGTNITISTPAPDSGKQTVVKTVLTGRGDPGYTLTAVMISEAALSLLLDKSKLPLMGQEGGILTPTTALGDTLIERLRASSRFDFESKILAETE